MKILKLTMKKAVFLDRDGVINEEVDSLHKLEDLKMISGSAEAIKLLNDNNFLIIIITNQSAIAKGFLTEEGLNEINEALKREITIVGGHIDDIFYCPHYPKYKEGYRKDLCIDCECRKPKTKLIDDAIKKYDIDVNGSFMVGDSTRDILSGKNAGLKTIIVETGYGGNDGKYNITADYTFKNLFKAAEFITNN